MKKTIKIIFCTVFISIITTQLFAAKKKTSILEMTVKNAPGAYAETIRDIL